VDGNMQSRICAEAISSVIKPHRLFRVEIPDKPSLSNEDIGNVKYEYYGDACRE
jgi:hypothetical protein